MPITTSTMVNALDANLNEAFLATAKKKKTEYDTIFNVGNSDKQSEVDAYWSGFGAAPAKGEGTAATYDTIQNGPSTTYVNRTYALGYEITEEAIEDNLHSPQTFNKLPEALGNSCMETAEITSANTFNNGFSTNGYDGVPLFSTAHVNTDLSTWANRPSTDADLSVTSLTAALTAIENYTDERGLKNPTKGVLLVVPPDSWNVAAELLTSEYKPYTGNNERNALMEKDLRYFLYHYLTDTDMFAVLAEKEYHHLKFFWRVKLGALRRGTDFDSTNLKHLARMRFSVGYTHARGTYGSRGA